MKRDVGLARFLLLAVVLSVSAATAWQIWSTRKHALAEIDVGNLNLAKALNIYADGVFTQSAVLLLGLSERLEAEGREPESLRRIQSLVRGQEQLLDQLSGISILDAQGDSILQSRTGGPSGNSSAERAYFLHHRNSPSRDFFIGPPIKSRSSGEWVITISRRLEDPDGKFTGVVAVTLAVESFLQPFGSIDIGSSGAISLATTSGQLLVRYPYREQDVGRDFSKSPNFLRHYADVASGTASFRSSLDGIPRIYAFRKSDRYPVVTTVALGQSEALRAWRRQSLLTLSVVGVLLATMAMVGRRLIINIQHRVSAEASLMAAREELLKANGQLELLATQDQLTGVANRRGFDETLSLECRRAAREGASLALVLIDLDYFKHFNDTYGHLAGDKCLQTVAAELQHCARRPGDLVARYGGEELVVILPRTDLQGAKDVADLLVARIHALNIPHRASPHGRVTCSAGASSFQGIHADGVERRLIEAADRALYEAKESGRNRSAS
ncbi:diguanylate cyclase [Variovorax paradoxus]|uniref:diguanylate cyclase domain-containing protein n=1 Tax=Variovorax paradoxus TaxID=34073 RepID=UPI0021ACB7BB|nr:diguanylate cyclase [Variovorax paradoxus]UVH58595.1 diguanylate cyclase [Variovorax paradoxus]